jgi:hypothetical protein
LERIRVKKKDFRSEIKARAGVEQVISKKRTIEK